MTKKTPILRRRKSVSSTSKTTLRSLHLERVLEIIKEAAASAGMKITKRNIPLLYQSEGLTGLVESELGKVDVTKYEDGLSACLVKNAEKMEEAEEKANDAKRRKRNCSEGENKSARTKTRSSPCGSSSTSTSSTSTTTSTTSSTSTSTSADENVAPKANVAKDKQSPMAKPMVQG